MSDYYCSRREGIIKAGYMFNSVSEVARLFGVRPGRFCFHIRFDIPDHKDRICIALSDNQTELEKKEWINLRRYGDGLNSSGWREVVAVEESNVDAAASRIHVEEEMSRPLERYVFWKEEKRGSKFVIFYGVFKLNVQKTREMIDQGHYTCVYQRVSEVGECLKDGEKK